MMDVITPSEALHQSKERYNKQLDEAVRITIDGLNRSLANVRFGITDKMAIPLLFDEFISDGSPEMVRDIKRAVADSCRKAGWDAWWDGYSLCVKIPKEIA